LPLKNTEPRPLTKRRSDKKQSDRLGLNLKAISRVLLGSVACATLLAGCVTSGQGQLAVGPNRVGVAVAATPPVVVEGAYQPLPTDVYVAAAVDRDIFVAGGDTYIWVRGPDGIRRRHLYAHGDHRAEIFHRREELHRVMASHQGHLPDHAIAGHPQMGRPEMPHGEMARGEMGRPEMGHGGMGHPEMGHPGMGHPEMGHPEMGRPEMGRPGGPAQAPGMAGHAQPRPGSMPVAHASVPGKPAPAARPAPKDRQKS
jgi:hypothetical protein